VGVAARAQRAARLTARKVDRAAATPDLDESFGALSDRTRRDVIRALMHKPRSAGELARHVAVSPQALSRHLRVLRKAGLVAEQGLETDARVRIYNVRPIALEPVQEWLWQIEDIWRRQLQSFKTYAESSHRGRRTRS
jgi:DNA-binding transcriptional ArsR family regulator